MGKLIKLGDTVQCIHTGVKGVAVAKTEFYNGCIQYTIAPKATKEGKLPEEVGIDEQSLKIVIAKTKPRLKRTTGGPRNKAPRQRGF
ncbi:hypothetical protein DRH27_02240 [Candidatus Falkowbacteria bacterium]|nr:MAG: hypothetical protein DRH27_02240 [Candidatus Falkowbacteria bacterium]